MCASGAPKESGDNRSCCGCRCLVSVVEEREAAARDLADKWFSGAAGPVIDAVIRQHLADMMAKG